MVTQRDTEKHRGTQRKKEITADLSAHSQRARRGKRKELRDRLKNRLIIPDRICQRART